MRTQVALIVGTWTALGAIGCGSDSSADNNPADASPDVAVDVDAGPPPSVCTEDLLAGGCIAGHCRLTAPRGTLAAGTSILLAEKALPPELAQDALGKILCDVTLPQGGSLAKELDLAITLDGPSDSAAALFLYKAQGGSALVTTSSSQAQGAAGNITASGSYGITKRSGPWQILGYAGQDVDSTSSPAAVLRNISTRTTGAAYWDGTRLYVGNGPRLLVYKGLPATPSQAPDLVLGQPDLNTIEGTASSSVFRADVRGVWSNGTKLVVVTGSRALVWNTIPTASFAPADLVLGQPDFSTDVANNGGVSATSLNQPAQVDSDGTRLAIADVQNHRVLVWGTFPVTLGQPATSVIGQPVFTSNTILSGATPIYQAWGVSLAGSGAYVSSLFGFYGMQHISAVSMNPPADFSATVGAARVTADTTYTAAGIAQLAGGALALGDVAAQRIGIFRSAPAAAGDTYDFVLGQPDPGRQIITPVNASSSPTLSPTSISGSGSRLLLPDGNRLLVFDGPSYNYEPASFVVGQAGYSANGPVDYRAIGATTLASPADVAISGTSVAVADRANNRVLIYDKTSLPNKPAAAKVVLGQPDFVSYVANGDLNSANASRLSGPSAVALDATHLVVADSENHRILIWSPIPTANGAPASVVLGQADFAGHRPNHGRGDTSPVDGYSDSGNNGFFYPTGVATDGTHLVVSDRMNHRVLVWNSIPTANDAPADAVIGQATFGDNIANRGAGPYGAQSNGFNFPAGVAIGGTALFVADTENNRVVRVSNAFTTPTADAWIGQPDGVTVTNSNYVTSGYNTGLGIPNNTSVKSVLRPRDVLLAGAVLYVTEQDSNRVHMLDGASFANVGTLGQTDPTSAKANAGGIGAASLAEPAGLATDGTALFVADAKNHRVVGYDVTTIPTTGASASLFVGQPTPVSSGFNQASSASGSTSGRPRGLARFGTDLYVADTAHHRVLVLTTPPKPGDAPTRVLGQPDANLILPNAGGTPTARTLSSPRGVFVDAQHVVVTDSGNNRVLIFDRASPSPDATLVLGQLGFGGVLPNAGGAASLGTLNSPESAFSDGTRLYVADAGNHRVLVWNNFPTQSGQPADLVLGQAAGDQVLSNHGNGGATADGMSSPTAVSVIGGALFVADSGNNRVLRFVSIPTASGAAASTVLGQADLVSRGSAASPSDTSRLAGPVSLADDGANLYVVDRDLGRIVSYALPADASGAPSTTIYGAAGGLSVAGPAGVVMEPTPFFTSRMYIADTNNDRLVILGSVSRLIGQ